MTQKFDLHMHSACSDGADSPQQVVENAVDAGLSLMALTDHDTMAGTESALAAGGRLGIRVLPSLEMDTEWPSEVHILGIDVNGKDPGLTDALKTAALRRDRRNAVILEKLKASGVDVAPCLHREEGSVTRLHIALAIVEAGYAHSLSDAFSRFLRKGMPGYYTVERFSPEDVIRLILDAGGVPIWAHPFHAAGNLTELLDRLKGAGLMGMEVYHSSATEGQSRTLLSIAAQHKLLVTCGSDSHGANRPQATIGCTWRDTPELAHAYAYFMERTEGR